MTPDGQRQRECGANRIGMVYGLSALVPGPASHRPAVLPFPTQHHVYA